MIRSSNLRELLLDGPDGTQYRPIKRKHLVREGEVSHIFVFDIKHELLIVGILLSLSLSFQIVHPKDLSSVATLFAKVQTDELQFSSEFYLLLPGSLSDVMVFFDPPFP